MSSPFDLPATLVTITLALFWSGCVFNLAWIVASTKYCELSRTMNELMHRLRALRDMGLRKGIEVNYSMDYIT